MERLGLEVPQFQLQRQLVITTSSRSPRVIEVGGVASGRGFPPSLSGGRGRSGSSRVPLLICEGGCCEWGRRREGVVY